MTHSPSIILFLSQHFGWNYDDVMKMPMLQIKEALRQSLNPETFKLYELQNLMGMFPTPKCEKCGGDLDPNSPDACPEILKPNE